MNPCLIAVARQCSRVGTKRLDYYFFEFFISISEFFLKKLTCFSYFTAFPLLNAREIHTLKVSLPETEVFPIHKRTKYERLLME